MSKLFQTFLNSEDGAVTVDWVVLTAAVVGLGIAAVATVQGGVATLALRINTEIVDAPIGTDGTNSTDNSGG